MQIEWVVWVVAALCKRNSVVLARASVFCVALIASVFCNAQLVFLRNGIPSPLTWGKFPTVTKVLDKIREEFATDMPRGSMELSVLGAGGHISSHCGPVNYRLRLHLGLVVPEGSGIRVGEEQRTWQVGKVLLIDDSFEHEVPMRAPRSHQVWNNATTPRAVLLVDVWHPKLSEAERDHVSNSAFVSHDSHLVSAQHG